MNLTPLVSTFAIIAIAELGDKTQLTAITLCTRYSPKIVFLSSMFAFILVGGFSVGIGSALANFLPMFWVKLGSGIVFVFSGVYTFFSGEDKSEQSCPKATFATSFALVGLMELGDKTQFAAIALSARYVSPFLVFGGVISAFALVTGVGVILGSKVQEVLPTRYIKIGSALLFVVFGILFITNAFLGLSIL